MTRLVAFTLALVGMLAVTVLPTTQAFAIVPSSAGHTQRGTHLSGWLDGAFANDDKLSKPQNAGLSNGPKFNENVTVNGKAVQGAVVGQKLTVVAGRARVKIPVNCQQGDCGTCMVKFNGRKVKACQATLPAGKATIQTL